MANDEQLKILRQGVDAWNKWMAKNPRTHIDLSGADLSGAKLREANLWWANLSGAKLRRADLSGAKLRRADLSGAKLREANLSEANLKEAKLSEANLSEANLSGADLSGASLSGASLRRAKLREANLNGADLRGAIMVETCLENAALAGCTIYGISAWGLKLRDAKQKDLIITPPDEPVIIADNLEVAQFIYLLLHNEKVREVIDTITSKVVLILGRFTPDRKVMLDAIREALRSRGYLPVLFDFEKPASLGLTETVSTLAHMAKFIIADITDAKSIPAELAHIVPQLPSVPVQPLILSSDYEYALFEFILKFKQVLEPYRYENPEKLINALEEKVIAPAEEKAEELRNPAK